MSAGAEKFGQRARFNLSEEVRTTLESISRSRLDSAQHVERAKMIWSYASGSTIAAIAQSVHPNRLKRERFIHKAMPLGPLTALDDIPRNGRPVEIPDDARAWVVSLACQKPKDLGYPEELWSTRLLAELYSRARSRCRPSKFGETGLRNRNASSDWERIDEF